VALPQAPLVRAAFGLLVVVSEAPGGFREHRRVTVRCTCGTEKIVLVRSLRDGRTKSCGLCARWRADPDRTISANHARIVLLLAPSERLRLAAVAEVNAVTPTVFARSALEALVEEAAEARVAIPTTWQWPERPSIQVAIKLMPSTRIAAEQVAQRAKAALADVVRLAVNRAADDSGLPPVFVPVVRVPGFASRHPVMPRPWFLRKGHGE